jgi:hypothetical protein
MNNRGKLIVALGASAFTAALASIAQQQGINRCLPADCGGLHGVLTGTGLGSVITQRDVE